MAITAVKTDEALWQRVKEEITAGDKGGRVGQWSARKAQLAVHEYRRRGGDYVYPGGERPIRPATGEDLRSPIRAVVPDPSGGRGATRAEYARAGRQKRLGRRRGQSHPRPVGETARKSMPNRQPSLGSLSKPELQRRAAQQGIRGRSRMNKVELVAALQEERRP